jgi:hypothetical protein
MISGFGTCVAAILLPAGAHPARQAEARAGGQTASEVEDENENSGLLEDVIAALVTLTVRTFLALLRVYCSMLSPGRAPDT